MAETIPYEDAQSAPSTIEYQDEEAEGDEDETEGTFVCDTSEWCNQEDCLFEGPWLEIMYGVTEPHLGSEAYAVDTDILNLSHCQELAGQGYRAVFRLGNGVELEVPCSDSLPVLSLSFPADNSLKKFRKAGCFLFSLIL